MPPFDESGGIIEPGQLYIEREDGAEYIVPSIGTAEFVPELSGEDKAKYESYSSGIETHLTAEAEFLAKQLMATIQKMTDLEKENAPVIIKAKCNELLQDMVLKGQIQQPVVTENVTGYRERRRAIRREEKNRRRRLKGLKTKPNPYPRALSFTFVLNMTPMMPVDMKFEMEDEA